MAQMVDKTLLIDDSEIDLFIHRRFLELCHFSKELICCKSAESALEILKDAGHGPAPDIIFLDLNMPVMDGFSFLKHFVKLPSSVTNHSRIVVLTSSNSPSDREQVLLCKNVIDMIPKPLQQPDVEKLRLLVTA